MAIGLIVVAVSKIDDPLLVQYKSYAAGHNSAVPGS